MNDHPQLALDNQLCFSLYRASRAVTRAYQPLLQNLGLTYPQYLTMLVLWEGDQSHSMQEITQRLGLDSGTLTPVCRRLEQAGLVTRDRDPADERRLIIALTDRGRGRQREAEDIPGQLERLYRVPGLDAAALKQALDLLSGSLD